jgi:hypothetical protein
MRAYARTFERKQMDRVAAALEGSVTSRSRRNSRLPSQRAENDCEKIVPQDLTRVEKSFRSPLSLHACAEADRGRIRFDISTLGELCIADDASVASHIPDQLRRADDLRIKWLRRSRNGNVSAASKFALSLATGEFVPDGS